MRTATISLKFKNGEYTLEYSTPNGGYSLTKADQSNNDAVDSDAQLVNGKYVAKATIQDDDNMTVDAGFYKSVYNIGDFVWNDTNKTAFKMTEKRTCRRNCIIER